jgi:hypothetical protein
MIVFQAVGTAVIHFGSGKLGIQFAGPVPGAPGRGYTGTVTLVSKIPELCEQISRPHAPVGKSFVLSVVFTPAGKAVAENELKIRHTHFHLSYSSIVYVCL